MKRLWQAFALVMILGSLLAHFAVWYTVHPENPLTRGAFAYMATFDRNEPKPSSVGLERWEEISLEVDGLVLSAWFIPAAGSTAGREAGSFATHPSPAVILCGGYMARKYGMLPVARILADAGYSSLLLDLRGNGRSQGTTTFGLLEAHDVQAAVDYLTSRDDVGAIGGLGRSAGGVAMILTAAQDPRLEAIVVDGVFASFSLLLEEKLGMPSFLLKVLDMEIGASVSALVPREAMARVHQPVLIIHGRYDNVIGLHHAYELYQAARGPRELWIAEEAGHANSYLITPPDEFQGRLIAFFDRYLGGARREGR
jgi:pimeloyl-ACP methyl ester carboxylesterase